MKYLFFDTETTGVPKDYKAPMTDLENWPRIIQLAYIVCDSSGGVLEEFCELIKPDGWVVPNEKFWIDNGYSTEKNAAFGVPVNKALNQFINAHSQCDLMVAHNINFDYNVVGAEMIRAGLKSTKRLPQYCTMLNSVDVCKLDGKYGYKWPRLQELHKHFFNTEFEDAHDALADVRATAKCFFELNSIEK